MEELFVGQYYVSQALLKPERNLTPGVEYTLVIDQLPAYELLKKFNSQTHKYEPYVFTVKNTIDNIKPTFSGEIKELKKTLIHYGCGPSENVVFNCSVVDESAYLIKASVKNLKSGTITTYLIESKDNIVKIGHDMCSGAFTFRNSEEYEITFGIVDASGNFTESAEKPIKFSRPTENNSSRED